MYENYLAHYGIIGMKWGVRRYQNRDGSLTTLGKKRLGVESSGTSSGDSPRHKPSNARKKALAEKAAAEKAAAEQKAKEEFEAGKRHALERGNAAEIMKYKGSLTNKEMQDALNRINLEKQLSSLAASETKNGWDKIDSMMNKVGKMKNWADKGIEVYNLMAKIHNTFTDSDEEKMRIIGSDNKKGPTKEDKQIDKIVKTGTKEEVLKEVKAGKLTPKQQAEALSRFKTIETLSSSSKQDEGSKPKTESKPKAESKPKSESKSKTPHADRYEKETGRTPWNNEKDKKTWDSYLERSNKEHTAYEKRAMKKRMQDISDEVDSAFDSLSSTYSSTLFSSLKDTDYYSMFGREILHFDFLEGIVL